MDHFATKQFECIVQEDHMNERSREEFLGRFTGNEAFDLKDVIHMDIEVEEEKILLGFCVMGGIFSEGIDLKNDGLIGAVIVGTGLPQVCNEREILKNYFDSWGENGFDYAYRYPGRIIRVTAKLLSHPRFLSHMAALHVLSRIRLHLQPPPGVNRRFHSHSFQNRSTLPAICLVVTTS